MHKTLTSMYRLDIIAVCYKILICQNIHSAGVVARPLSKKAHFSSFFKHIYKRIFWNILFQGGIFVSII